MAHGPLGHSFDSIPRHITNLTPLYLAIALFLTQLPVKFRWLALVLSIVQLGLLSAWFASGRWVS
jgi:hypothetical protein